MNRAERRRAGVKASSPAVTMTRQALEAAEEAAERRGYNRCLEQTTELYLAVFCLALRDKFGFGTERIASVIDGCMFMLAQVAADELDFRDCIETLADETGIELAGNGHDLVIRNLPQERMEQSTRWGVSKDVRDLTDKEYIAYKEMIG